MGNHLTMGSAPRTKDLIRLAYDRTAFQTGKFRWSYANGILNSWYQQGLKTLQGVEAAEARRSPKTAQPRSRGPEMQTPAVAADDIDRFFQEARRANHKQQEG